MVDVAKIARQLSKLSVLKYFPADKGAAAALTELVCEMASSDAQVEWLVKRALSLYNEWPGPRELRACFCSRFRPRDGIEVYSEVYPDGIPSENPDPPLALPGPKNGAISADRQIAAAVCDLAAAKAMPAPGKRMPRAIPAPMVAETPAQKNFTPITQADIDAAVRENHERAAKAELEVE